MDSQHKDIEITPAAPPQNPPDYKLTSDNRSPEAPPDSPPGLYTQSGKLLFESPSPLDILNLQNIDQRITYFHFRVPVIPPGSKTYPTNPQYEIPQGLRATFPIPDDQLEELEIGNSQGIPKNLFSWECVSPHLAHYLAEKYQGKDIAVRGTACFVSTFVQDCVIGGKVISNPVGIVRGGLERKGDFAPMLGFHSDDSKIPYRTEQWLTQHPEELRVRAVGEERADLAASIFPILLVYDRTKFPPGITTLPTDPAKRAKCIFEAIILDYPLSRNEFKKQT